MDQKTLTFKGFAGLDNRARDFALPEGYARNIRNADVLSSGKVQRRKGYTKLVSDTNPHSLYSNGLVTLYVAQGALKRLDGSVMTVLDADWGDAPTAYADRAGEVFFSNGLKTGRYAQGHQVWGTENPPFQPTPELMPNGGLFPGTYQLALTWRDGLGIESGTPLNVQIDVPEGGGILLTDFPAPPAYVESVAVYISSANGSELYLDNDYPAWTTSVVIGQEERSIPLDTEFMQPMPPVEHLCAQGGRVYGSIGPALYVTNPFNPYLTSLDGVLFEAPLTALLPVTDGVYAITERKSYFLSFDAGDVPQRRELAYHGAIRGAAGFDPILPGVIWVGEKGVMRGLPGGENQNLTDAHVAMPHAERGALLIRETDGERFAIVSLRGCSANPLTAQDWASRYADSYPV